MQPAGLSGLLANPLLQLVRLEPEMLPYSVSLKSPLAPLVVNGIGADGQDLGQVLDAEHLVASPGGHQATTSRSAWVERVAATAATFWATVSRTSGGRSDLR